MPHVKKQHAGADSYGHEWPADGAVVEVTDEQAADLVAIPDGGFTVVDALPAVQEPDEPPVDEPVDEPVEDALDDGEPPEDKPTDPPKRKPGRPRKAI